MIANVKRLVRWLFVACRKDVGSAGVAHVVATMRPTDELDPGATAAASTDVALEVVAQVGNPDVQHGGELLFDLLGEFGFDHVPIQGDRSDGTDCPLTVGIEGRDLVLFAASERLGVLLEPPVARALGMSLIAASEEAMP